MPTESNGYNVLNIFLEPFSDILLPSSASVILKTLFQVTNPTSLPLEGAQLPPCVAHLDQTLYQLYFKIDKNTHMQLILYPCHYYVHTYNTFNAIPIQTPPQTFRVI